MFNKKYTLNLKYRNIGVVRNAFPQKYANKYHKFSKNNMLFLLKVEDYLETN